jgi:hypothetical protein
VTVTCEDVQAWRDSQERLMLDHFRHLRDTDPDRLAMVAADIADDREVSEAVRERALGRIRQVLQER